MLILSFLPQRNGVYYIDHPDDSLDALYFGFKKIFKKLYVFLLKKKRKTNDTPYVK